MDNVHVKGKYSFRDTLVGEALVGVGAEVAHIDLVIGKKGGAVEQAFVAALASPAKGHTPLLAVLAPNMPTKPPTLIVNKVTIKMQPKQYSCSVRPRRQSPKQLWIVYPMG